MSTNGIVQSATFEDKYGEERVVRKTRHGWQVKNQSSTPALKMNRAVSGMIGARIRAERERQGLTLVALAVKAGFHSGHPKNRMWEIENAIRQEGVRMGTLYAIALALGVEASTFMPTTAEVAEAAKVSGVEMTSLVAD